MADRFGLSMALLSNLRQSPESQRISHQNLTVTILPGTACVKSSGSQRNDCTKDHDQNGRYTPRAERDLLRMTVRSRPQRIVIRVSQRVLAVRIGVSTPQFPYHVIIGPYGSVDGLRST